jgi:hypothetical protein
VGECIRRYECEFGCVCVCVCECVRGCVRDFLVGVDSCWRLLSLSDVRGQCRQFAILKVLKNPDSTREGSRGMRWRGRGGERGERGEREGE